MQNRTESSGIYESPHAEVVKLTGAAMCAESRWNPGGGGSDIPIQPEDPNKPIDDGDIS